MTYRRRIATQILCCALLLLPLACGSDGNDNQSDEQIMNDALRPIGRFKAVQLDTAELAAAVQAGQPITLPFALQRAQIVDRQAQLTLRNLRSEELTEFILKDGDAGSAEVMPLPPPATYQGTLEGGGAAVFTVTDSAVEGSMLAAPDGWAFIEPLEPQLRQRNVAPAVRQRLLRTYNHIVYNWKDVRNDDRPDDDPGQAGAVGEPLPPVPLVLSIVADGDVEMLRAYPLDSVMPFWLKQETMLNGIDWLYNCLEPDANAENAYSDCDNEFDGGSNGFQARVRIDRFEVWSSGGPDATNRVDLVKQSTAMTHQSSPPCCGPPHTAGRSSLVHFFTGKRNQGGYAAGIGGLNYYGERCSEDDIHCHHALSQMVPDELIRNSTFHQVSLVAHEIGHNNGCEEIHFIDDVCWLFGTECGTSLMTSGQSGFGNQSVYLYSRQDAQNRIGPLLAEQLEAASIP